MLPLIFAGALLGFTIEPCHTEALAIMLAEIAMVAAFSRVALALRSD